MLLRKKNTDLEEELQAIKSLNNQYEIELDIIKWHIKFLQDGRQAKQILADYDQACIDLSRLRQNMENLKMNHEKELKKKEKRNDELFKKLQMQQ